jgi:type I restriction-modification system DNA methylase subunit
VLFRGLGPKAHIREYLIRDLNVLDAVIGLPAQIFYGTSIPTSILVLKKRPQGREDNILFIDASQHYEKVKTQNKLRAEDVDRIVSTYRERTAQAKYSHVATLGRVEGQRLQPEHTALRGHLRGRGGRGPEGRGEGARQALEKGDEGDGRRVGEVLQGVRESKHAVRVMEVEPATDELVAMLSRSCGLPFV